MENCYCGLPQPFARCCEPYLKHEKFPLDPEALMRSRYTAFVLRDANYIRATMRGVALQRDGHSHQLPETRWLQLVVKNSRVTLTHGSVEFLAYYAESGARHCLHEISQFENIEGKWFYVDGEMIAENPQKISRNDACPCGSGKKFKHCCGS